MTPSTSGTFFGPSQTLGNGSVRTYTTLDDGGRPTEVGLRLTATALDGLPETSTGLPPTLMLDFPDQASETAFDHVMLNWNAQGHEPPVQVVARTRSIPRAKVVSRSSRVSPAG